MSARCGLRTTCRPSMTQDINGGFCRHGALHHPVRWANHGARGCCMAGDLARDVATPIRPPFWGTLHIHSEQPHPCRWSLLRSSPSRCLWSTLAMAQSHSASRPASPRSFDQLADERASRTRKTACLRNTHTRRGVCVYDMISAILPAKDQGQMGTFGATAWLVAQQRLGPSSACAGKLRRT